MIGGRTATRSQATRRSPNRSAFADAPRSPDEAGIHAGAAGRFLALQRLAGNRAVSKAVPVQRQIFCELTPGGRQFQINATRPAWIGPVAVMPLLPTQDRCHVIAFEVIQNDLANILNAVLANLGGAGLAAQLARLVAFTDSLFPTPSPSQAAMVLARNGLVTDIQAVPAVPRGVLTWRAQNLLRLLNSSPDNIRAGDSGLNISIGYSIDADFLPGTHWYQGPVVTNAPAPPVGVLPGGAVPVPAGPGGAGTIPVGPIECVMLTAPHESLLWNYQVQSGLTLAFVLNGMAGALNAAAAQCQHLSSGVMPPAPPIAFPVVPYPVLVRSPVGGAYFLYQ